MRIGRLLAAPLGVVAGCGVADPPARRPDRAGPAPASGILGRPVAPPPPPARRAAAAVEPLPAELEREDARLASLTPVAVEEDSSLDEVAPAAPDAFEDPDRALASIAKETLIFSAPSWRAKKIGYLRAGAVVRRSPDPAGHAGCGGGWYRIEPDGFVCAGRTAALDPAHPVVRAVGRPPDRGADLPYAYGLSRFPTPPFYTKLPSAREQRMVEIELTKHLRGQRGDAWTAVPDEPLPDFLAAGRPSPTLHGYVHSPRSLHTGRALPKSGFALLRAFTAESRRFALSADLDVMPLDRLKPVVPSAFRGVELGDALPLPIVFVRSRYALAYTGDPRTVGLVPGRALAYREAVPVTGKRIKSGSSRWVETRDGAWLKDESLVWVNPFRERPSWAVPGRTWLDVSILRQTLVAYEGTRPVYATLVSTGADGIGDPKETHSTVQGQFLIHTKHVSVTMSGDEVGDEFDLRDVPWVQYFTEGYALHAVYWHDSFGAPRSHGCINLSPGDARWLFEWTDPPVPEKWHGAMSLREGTLVNVHP
jgi:hypothetical protein